MTPDERRTRRCDTNRRYRERHRAQCKAYADAYRERHRKAPPPLPESKRCAHCGVEKPRDQFSPRTKFKNQRPTRGALGVEAVCNACRSEIRKPSLAAERAHKSALANAGQKRCGTCRRIKPLAQFHVRRASRDGLAYCCSLCVTQRSKRWRQAHPDAFKEWLEQNKDSVRQRVKEWRENHRDLARSRYQAWARANSGVVLANLQRRELAKRKATPSWADLRAIKAIYVEAARLKRQTGIRHDVDHIVPIRSKVVCGLHVACNLQILTRAENLEKSNHYEAAFSSPV